MKLDVSDVSDEILQGEDFSKSVVHVTYSPQSREWTDETFSQLKSHYWVTYTRSDHALAAKAAESFTYWYSGSLTKPENLRNVILSMYKLKDESETARTEYTISYLAYLALHLLRLATKDPSATAAHIILTTDARIKNFFSNRDNHGLHDTFLACHLPPTYQSLMFL